MPKPTGLVGSIRDICDPAAHHFQSVPRLRARLEDFEEIWQFDCLRRGAALVVPGPKCSKLWTNLRKIEPNAAISPRQFRPLESTLIGCLQAIDASDLDPTVASDPQSRSRTMKMRYLLAASLLSLAVSATAQARTNEHRTLPQAYGSEGREVAAPSWSAACMTDHGPSQCGEPMWVYGSPGALARYKSAF
jgi:hypothetical protein